MPLKSRVKAAGRHRCSEQGCSNRYQWPPLAKGECGPVCVPCYYARQLIGYKETPEWTEGQPVLIEAFRVVLELAGWTWQDVKDSYARLAPPFDLA